MVNKFFHLQGWRRYLAACLLGFISALAYPPFGLIFAPLVAFPIWLSWLQQEQNESWRRHFALGWFFGLGYFTLGLYWITFSLGVDLSLFWWLIPFSLFGIPIYLSLFIGAMAVVLKWTNSQGLARCFLFAFLWSITELAWSSGILALPWNPLGSIWYNFNPILQSISFIGIDGLTVLTALFVSFPTLFIARKMKILDKAYLTCLILLLMLAGGYGALRLNLTPVEKGENLPLIRLVQPNIPQYLKWDPHLSRQHFFEVLDLSMQDKGPRPDIIIWPESALPIFLLENNNALDFITPYLKDKAYLIAGTPRRELCPPDHIQVWNSLVVVNNKKKIIALYDKQHLVPFGEFVPFRTIIPSSVTKITSGEIDFSRGEGLKTLHVDEYPPFSPLICFEAIFSGEVVARGLPKPQWLLTITNDAWFGNTSGPYQHLHLTRLRTIEEGMPLVRVANNGISAVYDSFGREVASLGLNQKGILDVKLPPALANPTIFAQYGTIVYILLLVAIFSLGIVFKFSQQK